VVEPKEGDAVREGQIVARLMDEVAQASLDVAKLVADDHVEIQFATKLNAVDAAEYAKDLEANKQHLNTVPDIEVRRAKLAMEKSHLQIDKAEHDMAVNKLKADQAEAELKTYRIVAPFNGVVTHIHKRRGEAVRQGDPILEVVNTDMVQVEGYVNEREIWSVKVGCPVTVRLSVPDAELNVEKQTFQGRIGFVDVVADSASRETRVWAEVANPNNVLRPGLRATMTILPASPEAVGLKTSMISGPATLIPRPSRP
jgi:membrane fusion protein (multidrug efflux system)